LKIDDAKKDLSCKLGASREIIESSNILGHCRLQPNIWETYQNSLSLLYFACRIMYLSSSHCIFFIDISVNSKNITLRSITHTLNT